MSKDTTGGFRRRRRSACRAARHRYCRAARLPWPTAIVTDAFAGDRVAAGEDPGMAGHHVVSTTTVPSAPNSMPGTWRRKPLSVCLAKRQHDGIGCAASRTRPVGCGRPLASSVHRLDGEGGSDDFLDGGEPLDLDAFLDAPRRPRRRAPACGRGRGGRRSAPHRRRGGAPCARHPSRCCRRRRRSPGGQEAAPRRSATSCSSETASSTRTASRAGMSTCLPTSAPIARKAASNPPAVDFRQDVFDFVIEDDLHAHRLDPARSRASDRRGAGDRPGCRNASCRRLPARLRGFRPRGPGGRDDRRRTSPLGPAPITSTRLPLGAAAI